MRIKALIIRILRQLKHDKRTLGLMMFAPLLLLTLIYFIFDASPQDLRVGVVNAPEKYIQKLEEQNLRIIRYDDVEEAIKDVEDQDIISAIDIKSGKPYIYIDGTSSSKTSTILNAVQSSGSNTNVSRVDLKSDITYIYGMEGMTMFDNFGSTLIGFLIFFFVFLVSGIAFLQERTSGTLLRLLSSPIRRWEIILGYVSAYGIVTLIQSLLIAFFIIYVLNVIMVGSVWLIVLITLLCAVCALTLGILISTAAQNEF